MLARASVGRVAADNATDGRLLRPPVVSADNREGAHRPVDRGRGEGYGRVRSGCSSDRIRTRAGGRGRRAAPQMLRVIRSVRLERREGARSCRTRFLTPRRRGDEGAAVGDRARGWEAAETFRAHAVSAYAVSASGGGGVCRCPVPIPREDGGAWLRSFGRGRQKDKRATDEHRWTQMGTDRPWAPDAASVICVHLCSSVAAFLGVLGVLAVEVVAAGARFAGKTI